MYRKLLAWTLGTILGLGLWMDTYANQVTVTVTAQVDYVYDYQGVVGSEVTEGQLIQGTYTFDTAALDQDPSPETGFYSSNTTGSGFDLSTGRFRFVTDPSHPNIGISILDETNGIDSYHVYSNQITTANGAIIYLISLDLFDPTETALSDALLHNVPPPLDAFADRTLTISGNYFQIGATLLSLHANGLCDDGSVAGGTRGIVGYDLTAQVSNIYDPANVLNGKVNYSSMATGTITVDNTAAPTPQSERSYYTQPMIPGLGLQINLEGLTFRSLSEASPVDVWVQDAYADEFHVESVGANAPLDDGTIVSNLILHLMDYQGTSLSSTELDATVPMARYSERFIWIDGTSEDGLNNYQISLAVSSITPKFSLCPALVSPAGGTYDPIQSMDLGLIFEKDVTPPPVTVQNNGNTVPVNCFAGSPNSEQRATLICPDFRQYLTPGSNNVEFSFDFGQTTYTKKLNFHMLGY